MNKSDVVRINMKDRELEELLCLAYLFTHSSSVQELDELEGLLTETEELQLHGMAWM